MAVAYLDYDTFIKMLIMGYVFKLKYKGGLYNIGTRYIGPKLYYFLNHQNLKLDIYYSLNDLINLVKIDEKSLEECWDEIEILRVFEIFDWDDEVKTLKSFKACMEVD